MIKRIKDLERMLRIAKHGLGKIRMRVNRDWVIEVKDIDTLIRHIDFVLEGDEE